MKLQRVEIENFRSIDSLTLDFEHGCQALIGINESGKSNILRALQLLEPSVAVTASDLRMERNNEPKVVETGYVRFVFLFSDDEVEKVYAGLGELFEQGSLSRPLFAGSTGGTSLKELCDTHRSGVYRVVLPSGERVETVFSFGEPTFLEGWLQNESDSPISWGDSEDAHITVPARGYYFLDGLAAGMHAALKPAKLPELSQVRVRLFAAIVAEKLPKCVFWKYSDQYLLPSRVNLTEFLANPNSCIPLKSMFELAGYPTDKLKERVEVARAQSQNRYVHILDRTATAASEHIRRVWKDHRAIQIRLTPDGDWLIPTILDEQLPLDMVNRSDGFKRFVSFLLQISAQVKLAEMMDALILIDEPEIALHPSGARALMKELIAIGQTNTVVYSTHSIFMVDRDNIDRHLIVEKQSEVTKTWRATRSRIQDEEVLYAAMGYSIFETVKQKNVVFEGWRDKIIFRVVAASMAKVDVTIKDSLDSIGLTHAEGVKDVKNVSQFLELAQRSCLVISDADSVALQYKKAYSTPGAWGEWKTLRDVGCDTAVTGEDLLVRAAVVKRANKVKSAVPGLQSLDEDFFNQGEPTAEGLKRWLRTAELAGDSLDSAFNSVKSFLYDGVKRAEILDEAEKLVRYVVGFDFLAKS